MKQMVAVPLLLRLAEMAAGLVVLSFGTVLMIRAGLGQSNGTAMLTVFSYMTGIRVGTLMTYMFLLFILGQLILIKGGFRARHMAQIIVAWAQGRLVDYFQYDCTLLRGANPTNYCIGWFFLILAVLMMSFGSAAIINADLVQMPVEGFVLEFSRRFGRNFGKVRQAVDVVWLILAVIGLLITGLPGTIREGTVFYTLVLGRSMNYTRPLVCHGEHWLCRKICPKKENLYSRPTKSS